MFNVQNSFIQLSSHVIFERYSHSVFIKTNTYISYTNVL